MGGLGGPREANESLEGVAEFSNMQEGSQYEWHAQGQSPEDDRCGNRHRELAGLLGARRA